MSDLVDREKLRAEVRTLPSMVTSGVVHGVTIWAEPALLRQESVLALIDAAPAVPSLTVALTDLLDDYLTTHGPDGYPQPMPESWRVVQNYLAALTETEPKP